MKHRRIIERQGAVNSRILVFLLFCLALSNNTFSQNSPILDEFSASETNGTVYLYWIISSGSTCDGIKIFRSVDNLHFDQIGEIGGVCGNSSAPQPYNFVDERPEKNSVNYYRLELGSNGFSETISVEIIDFNDKGFQVRPNPAFEKAFVFFQNDLRKSFSLALYSLNGQVTGLQSTDANSFNINTMNLSNGTYIFIIFSEDDLIKIKGKIIVAH